MFCVFVSCNFGLVWLWNSANHFKEHKRSAKKKEPKATASSHFSSVLTYFWESINFMKNHHAAGAGRGTFLLRLNPTKWGSS